MKYIIMAGGNYEEFKIPKQLMKVNGEVIIERTIRLLKENGIEDISISTNNPAFDYLEVPILKHENSYRTEGGQVLGYWCDAFYPTKEPTCYIFGDVYFSEKAIKKIIETETDDIEFFGSMPPFADNYPKYVVEPFALKVVNTAHLKRAITKTKKLEDEGKFWRKPIMWELWTVIKNVPLQTKPDEYIYNYVAINDYTSDVDKERDVERLENVLNIVENEEIKRIDELEDCIIILKAIVNFSLKDFDKLEDLQRIYAHQNDYGELYTGDVFKCDKEMAKYLLGDNPKHAKVAEIIEIKIN